MYYFNQASGKSAEDDVRRLEMIFIRGVMGNRWLYSSVTPWKKENWFMTIEVTDQRDCGNGSCFDVISL